MKHGKQPHNDALNTSFGMVTQTQRMYWGHCTAGAHRGNKQLPDAKAWVENTKLPLQTYYTANKNPYTYYLSKYFMKYSW
jgi:hypothetical protein